MNKRECTRFIDEYLSWLRRDFTTEIVGDACELTTPFLDRHNDHLQVYAVERNGSIELTDDGYILADLRASGLEINTPKRKAVLQAMLNGFGVQMRDRCLVVEASEQTLGQRLHSLIQAMLAVNDMFVMAQSRVESFFWEDVRAFLDEHDVRYSPRVKISGKSGFDHAIDFLIPKSRAKPERVVQAVNVPNRNTISARLFMLGDIREAREDPLSAFAFLNDTDHDIGGDVVEALEAYNVIPVPWSQRLEFVEDLAS